MNAAVLDNLASEILAEDDERDSYLADAPEEAPEETKKGRRDPFEVALERLGWERIRHGFYAHKDGSLIECHQGVLRGTNTPARVFQLVRDGYQDAWHTDYVAVFQAHRTGKGVRIGAR